MKVLIIWPLTCSIFLPVKYVVVFNLQHFPLFPHHFMDIIAAFFTFYGCLIFFFSFFLTLVIVHNELHLIVLWRFLDDWDPFNNISMPVINIVEIVVTLLLILLLMVRTDIGSTRTIFSFLFLILQNVFVALKTFILQTLSGLFALLIAIFFFCLLN